MSHEINVLQRTQIVFVEPSTNSVAVTNAGPAGGGGGGGAFELPFSQDSGANTHVIDVATEDIPYGWDVKTSDDSAPDDIFGQLGVSPSEIFLKVLDNIEGAESVIAAGILGGEPTILFRVNGNLALECIRSGAQNYVQIGGILSEAFNDYEDVSGAVYAQLGGGSVFRYRMVGNVTSLTISGVPGYTPGAATITLILDQDSTGSRTFTWPSSFKWPSGVPPVLSTAPNARDIVVAQTVDNGTRWDAVLSGNNFS